MPRTRLPETPADLEPMWSWDGNVDTPTFAPSYLIYESGNQPRCHSMIDSGNWIFQADCTHSLAGQTVPLSPLPDWILAWSEFKGNEVEWPG